MDFTASDDARTTEETDDIGRWRASGERAAYDDLGAGDRHVGVKRLCEIAPDAHADIKKQQATEKRREEQADLPPRDRFLCSLER